MTNGGWKVQLDCGEWGLVGSLRKFQVSLSQHHYTDVSLSFCCPSNRHLWSLQEVLLGNFKVKTCASPAQIFLIISGWCKGSFLHLANKMAKSKGSSFGVALDGFKDEKQGRFFGFSEMK